MIPLKGVCLLLLVLVIFPASTVRASLGDGDMRYEDGFVTVKGQDLNAMDLLDRISKAANIRIFIFDAFKPGRISLDIEERPLETFIRSVLNGHSFAVLYFSEDLSGLVANFGANMSLSPASLKETATTMRVEGVSGGTAKRVGTTRDVVYGGALTSRPPVPQSGLSGQPIEGGVFLWKDRDHSWFRQGGAGSALGVGQGEFYAGESDIVAKTANPTEPGYKETGIASPVHFPDTPGLTGRDQLIVRIEYLKERIASGESDAFYKKWEPIKGPYVTHDRVLLEHYEERLRNLKT